MKLKTIALFAAIPILLVFCVRIKTSPSRSTLVAPRTTAAAKIEASATRAEQNNAPQNTPANVKEWIAHARAAGNQPTASDLARGLQLATARREQMLRLMRENPAEAFKQSLSWSEWVALPERLRAIVEQPFSANVDFQVLPSCPPLEGAVNQVNPHRVILDGRAYDAFVYGSKAAMTSKENMPARGFLLDGVAVLSDAMS